LIYIFENKYEEITDVIAEVSFVGLFFSTMLMFFSGLLNSKDR